MSSTICVDANFVVGLVTDHFTTCASLWNQWQSSGLHIVAPTLIYYEITNAFHRLSFASQISNQQADQFLEHATNLEISLFGDIELHQRAMLLARQFSLPATYDSHYLALSERLEAQFWTADRRLYNSVCGNLEWIHLVT